MQRIPHSFWHEVSILTTSVTLRKTEEKISYVSFIF
jgi:hypothetical protein